MLLLSQQLKKFSLIYYWLPSSKILFLDFNGKMNQRPPLTEATPLIPAVIVCPGDKIKMLNLPIPDIVEKLEIKLESLRSKDKAALAHYLIEKLDGKEDTNVEEI